MSEKKGTGTDNVKKDYGVGELVPDAARHYSFFDMFATWVGANCSPNVWFLGGSIAALGLPLALGVNLTAVPLLFAIVATIGYIGFKYPTTAMGLTRFSFGIKGSRIISVFHVVSQLGWASVGCYLGAVSLSYMFNELLGWPTDAKWVLAIGTFICAGLTVLIVVVGGSRSVKKAENIGFVLMMGLSILIVGVVFSQYSLTDLLNWRPDAEISMTFGQGSDAIAAFAFGWIIAVVEFTRYTKTKVAATAAPLLGSWFGLSFFVLVGTVGVIGASLTTGVFDPNASDPSGIAAGLGLGLPAFFVILSSVVTTTALGVYVCASSAINLVNDKWTQKQSQIYSSIACFACAFVPLFFDSFLAYFYAFMNVLGIIWPPLGAIIIVDFYLVNKRKYNPDQLFNEKGPYFFQGGFNIRAWASFAIGAILVNVFQNIPAMTATTGAIYPAFFATGLIYLLLAKIGNKSTAVS